MFLSWRLSRTAEGEMQGKLGHYNKKWADTATYLTAWYSSIEAASLVERAPRFHGTPSYSCVSLFSCAAACQGYTLALRSLVIFMQRERVMACLAGCSGRPLGAFTVGFHIPALWGFPSRYTEAASALRPTLASLHRVNPVTSCQENIRAFKPSGNWWMDFLNVMSPYGM